MLGGFDPKWPRHFVPLKRTFTLVPKGTSRRSLLNRPFVDHQWHSISPIQVAGRKGNRLGKSQSVGLHRCPAKWRPPWKMACGKSASWDILGHFDGSFMKLLMSHCAFVWRSPSLRIYCAIHLRAHWIEFSFETGPKRILDLLRDFKKFQNNIKFHLSHNGGNQN